MVMTSRRVGAGGSGCVFERLSQTHRFAVAAGLTACGPTTLRRADAASLRARATRWFTENNRSSLTVTRVNSSSISTGAHPETHGLLGNTIYRNAPFRRAASTHRSGRSWTPC